MSNRKITDMVALTTPASDDVLPIVDISEAAAVDKNKKISIEELFKGAPNGTAAAPSIAFESDGDSGIFLAGTNTVGITTAGTQRVTVDSSGNVLVGTTDSTVYNNGDSDSEGIVLRNGEVVDIARKGDLQLTLNRQTNDGQHIGFFRSGSPKSYISTRNDAFCIDVNSSERLRIDSSGNIGIGQSNPSGKLEVSGGYVTLRNGASSYPDGISAPVIYGSTGGGSNSFDQTGNLVLQSRSDAGSYNICMVTGDTPTERLRISAAGLVGIGTASADRTLHVRKDDAAAVKFGGESGGDYAIEIGQLGSSSSPGFNATGGSSMLFRMGGTEAARLDSSGRLLVGTTTEGHSSANELTVASTGITGITIRSGTSDSGNLFFSDGTSGNDELRGYVQYLHADDALVLAANASEGLRILSNGNCGIGSTAPGHNLEVKGSFPDFAIVDSDTTNDKFRILHNGGATQLQVDPNNVSSGSHLLFSIDGSEAARLDSSGNLGVGTSAPGQLLHLNSSASTAIQISDGTNNQFISSIKTAGNFANGSTAGDVLIRGQSGFAVSSNNGSSVAMRIDSSGNTILGYAGNSLHFQNGFNNSTSRIQNGGGSNSSNFKFLVKNSGSESEAMRLDSSGRLLVGVSSGGANLVVGGIDTPSFNRGAVAIKAVTDGNSLPANIYLEEASGAEGYTLSIDSDGDLNFHNSGAATPTVTFSDDNKVGIGTATADGTLHVHSNSAGSVTANSGADDLVVENNGDAGISILTADGNNATAVMFGCPTQTVGAAIRYNHNSSEMALGPDQPGAHLRLNSGDGIEAARLDSSGRLLVGTSSAQTTPTDSRFQVSGTGFATSSIRQTRFESGTSGPSIILAHARGSEASNQSLANGDELGKIRFHGHDGTDFNSLGAEIIGEVDGTPGSNDMPGRLLFRTTADGASSPTERLRIRSTGEISAQGIYDTTSSGAANVFVHPTNYILHRSTSSIKYKKDVETLQDAYADAILECRPVWYKSKCANDNPDWGHWGFIAEEVEQIDPRLCHFGVDENGDQVVESVQYDRFVPHLLSLIKRQQAAIETLETKVAALEAG